MSDIYQFQTNLRLNFDTDFPVENIDAVVLKVVKPSGACEDWDAQIGSGTTVFKNNFTASTLNEAGKYSLQPIITDTDGKELPCDIVFITVKRSLKC